MGLLKKLLEDCFNQICFPFTKKYQLLLYHHCGPFIHYVLLWVFWFVSIGKVERSKGETVIGPFVV